MPTAETNQTTAKATKNLLSKNPTIQNFATTSSKEKVQDDLEIESDLEDHDSLQHLSLSEDTSDWVLRSCYTYNIICDFYIFIIRIEQQRNLSKTIK